MSEVYAVPGVYVTEPDGPSMSIQSGETAVPVFLGFFTPKTPPQKTEPLSCVRIESWLDFSQQFGPSDTLTVNLMSPTTHHATTYMGAHSVRLYFENGGGPCYVLNLPREVKQDISPAVIAQIVPAIELCPDITLLCWCEFVNQKMDTDIYAELAKLLAVSETSGGNPGRFLLTDAWPEATNEQTLPSTWAFKAPVVAENTQVASYFPALLTGYAWNFVDYKSAPDAGYEDFITVEGFTNAEKDLLNKLINKKLIDKDLLKPDSSLAKITLKSLRSTIAALTVDKVIKTDAVTGTNDAAKKSAAEALITQAKGIVTAIDTAVREEITAQRATPVVLRASVAMAGVYARVDRERGVWKAPANVGLVGVTGLIAQGATKGGAKWTNAIPVRIDDALNEKLVDAGVNAIRAFSGQGLRVWGARTMSPTAQTAWRYVSVRRLFNTIERDARSALRTAVFEPNSPPTWERVRGALENYLNALWRQGALQGETPEQAYFVHIGAGTTMTPKDIADGKMIVKVGVAAVRPAEFIILQLTQDVVAR